jgi:hypothetical protein
MHSKRPAFRSHSIGAEVMPSPRAVLALLLVPVVIGLAVSIVLWPKAHGSNWEELTLYAVAGALGGFLRSSAYGLASGNFTNREFKQWLTEALVSPVVGATAGLLAYFFVSAVLVSSGQVLKSGQYLVSLVVGFAALSLVGRAVERGLFRSTLSRSGIMGSESLSAVPIMTRFDQLLEERVSEATATNYRGLIGAKVETSDGQSNPIVEIQFFDFGHQTEKKWSIKELSHDLLREGWNVVQELQVQGGSERSFAQFNITATSADYIAIPSILTMTAPIDSESALGQIVLQRAPTVAVEGKPTERVIHAQQATADRREPSATVVLEVGQGSSVVQAIQIRVSNPRAS